MNSRDTADRLVDAILTEPTEGLTDTPDYMTARTVVLLNQAADALDQDQQTKMPASIACALATLLRAESAGLHAALGMPALLDTLAGKPTGTELRVSYSTIPELVQVARAVLATPDKDAY
jgi:hypothetical protein